MLNNSMFKKAVGYVAKENFFGVVEKYDFIKDELVLSDGRDKICVKPSNAYIMYEAFELNGTPVYHEDILESKSGKLYKVHLSPDGKISLNRMDEELKLIINVGEAFIPTKEAVMSMGLSGMKIKGNYYKILTEKNKSLEFNVKIVKFIDNENSLHYLYACHDKQRTKIDLIKVLYFGHHLLEEEDYERVSLSYKEYLKMVREGDLVEVSPQELHNYVLGTYKYCDLNSEDTTDYTYDEYDKYEEEEEEYDEYEYEYEEDYEICEECGEDTNECSSDLFDNNNFDNNLR